LPAAHAWRRLLAAALALPPAYAGMAVLLVLAAVLRPQLLSALLLPLIARQAAPLGLAVIGQSLVMRARSIDLSSGGVIVAVSYLLTSGYFPVSDAVSMGLCVALGLAVGVLNGVLIVKARASSMIVTLAVSMILTGIVVALSQFRAPGDAPEFLRELARQRVWGLPVPVLVWLGALLPAALLLKRTVYGRTLDAVGANPQAAALSGLPHLQVVFIGHVASALISVLCGFILVGFVGKGSVTLGQDLALNSLAAAILGGVNFGNGRGGMAGPAVAAFMLTFLFNFLTSLGLGEPGRLMLQGAIIAAAALAYSLNRR
jgi:ribose transport system permease protein